VLALLLVVTATFAARSAASPEVRSALTLHAALLVSFGALLGVLAWKPEAGWTAWARGVATVGVLLFLYTSLARSAFAAIPWRADSWLENADRFLFRGRSPALWAASHVGRAGLEAWSAIYGFFIPFLYLSILSGCVGRPAAERREFLLGFAVTYSIAYLGYLFLPSTGPIELLPAAAPP